MLHLRPVPSPPWRHGCVPKHKRVRPERNVPCHIHALAMLCSSSELRINKVGSILEAHAHAQADIRAVARGAIALHYSNTALARQVLGPHPVVSTALVVTWPTRSLFKCSEHECATDGVANTGRQVACTLACRHMPRGDPSGCSVPTHDMPLDLASARVCYPPLLWHQEAARSGERSLDVWCFSKSQYEHLVKPIAPNHANPCLHVHSCLCALYVPPALSAAKLGLLLVRPASLNAVKSQTLASQRKCTSTKHDSLLVDVAWGACDARSRHAEQR